MDASGAIELLKQIISIPSFSKQEDKVADLIADVLKRYRFDVHRKGNNVWSRSKNFDDAKPTLLLDAHLDTVRPNGTWDSDPFTPIVKEGKLWIKRRKESLPGLPVLPLLLSPSFLFFSSQKRPITTAQERIALSAPAFIGPNKH